MSAPPIGPAERDALFAGLADARGLLVAVSGGPDSVVLLHALAEWAAGPGRPVLVAATVDHGLRAEGAAEAEAVARQAGALGVPHRILPWTGEKPRTGVQAAARAARYRLLADAALAAGASHLVTAHTLDDQAETILMRIGRGSGLAGLIGMRPATARGGLVHARPFLTVPKARLLATCAARGWSYSDDPGNRDPRFARSRWRALQPALAREGLTPERLAALSRRAARIEAALDAKAVAALDGARRGGDPPAAFAAAAFAAEPFEIALRMLALALAAGREPTAGPLRLQRLEACLDDLRAAVAAGRPWRRTLAGTVLTLGRSGLVTIAAEGPRRRGTRAPGARGSAPDEDAVAAARPCSLGSRDERA